jgi:hypothetical protein
VRTLLFNRSFEDCAALLDTADLPPSRGGTREILDCRFYLQLFQRSPEALAAWSRCEYDIFIGKPERALQRMTDPAVPADLATALAIRIVNVLMARGRTDMAAAYFREHGEDVDSPEYLYLYASALIQTGGSVRAPELLSRIIRDYPNDVFAEKSRILLAKLRQ